MSAPTPIFSSPISWVVNTRENQAGHLYLYEQELVFCKANQELRLPLDHLYACYLSPNQDALVKRENEDLKSEFSQKRELKDLKEQQLGLKEDTNYLTLQPLPCVPGWWPSRNRGSKHSLHRLKTFSHHLQSAPVSHHTHFTVFGMFSSCSSASLKTITSGSTLRISSLTHSCKRPVHLSFTFAIPLSSSDPTAEAAEWVQRLQQKLVPSKRRVLVLVNPNSGRGKALLLYQNHIEPILTLSRLQVQLLVTDRPQHAFEVAQSMDLQSYDVLVTVSGDGLMHEVVNGFMQRRKTEPKAADVMLAVIPAGSGNAMAQSVGVGHPEWAALNLIKGRAHPLDIFSLTQFRGDETFERFAFLEWMWALIANVDLGSEALRWAGPSRFTLAAIWYTLRLQHYAARLSFLPSTGEEDFKEELTESVSNRETARLSSQTPPPLESPFDSSFDSPPHKDSPSVNASPSCSVIPTPTTLTMGSNRPLPKGWKSVDANFTYFMAMNVPWCASDFLVAPEAQLADGSIDLVWIQQATRLQILRVLLDTESGTYTQEPYVQTCKVKAFLLEPHTVLPKRTPSFMDVDGEAMPSLPVLVQVVPQALRMLVPPWFSGMKE